jgi:DNA-binding transcriptional MerR regulator
MKNGYMGEDCMTLVDFSKLVGISPKVLVQYDREGIFSPAVAITKGKRVFRYYLPAQSSTAKVLRVLWSIGASYKTIRSLSKVRSPEDTLKLLDMTLASLDNASHLIHRARSVVSTHLEALQEGMRISEKVVSIIAMPERRIILGEPNEFKEKEGYYGAFTRFCTAPHKPTLDLSYKIGGYFDSMEAFLTNPSQPSRFYSIDPNGHELIENRLYLVGYTRGPYGQTNDLPERMKAYADNIA